MRQKLHIVGREEPESAVGAEPLPPAGVDLLDVSDYVARVERDLRLVRYNNRQTKINEKNLGHYKQRHLPKLSLYYG